MTMLKLYLRQIHVRPHDNSVRVTSGAYCMDDKVKRCNVLK